MGKPVWKAVNVCMDDNSVCLVAQDLVCVVMLSLPCGWLCTLMGLPLMFGYIICGVLLGPSGLNSIKVSHLDTQSVISLFCWRVSLFPINCNTVVNLEHKTSHKNHLCLKLDAQYTLEYHYMLKHLDLYSWK